MPAKTAVIIRRARWRSMCFREQNHRLRPQHARIARRSRRTRRSHRPATSRAAFTFLAFGKSDFIRHLGTVLHVRRRHLAIAFIAFSFRRLGRQSRRLRIDLRRAARSAIKSSNAGARRRDGRGMRRNITRIFPKQKVGTRQRRAPTHILQCIDNPHLCASFQRLR